MRYASVCNKLREDKNGKVEYKIKLGFPFLCLCQNATFHQPSETEQAEGYKSAHIRKKGMKFNEAHTSCIISKNQL